MPREPTSEALVALLRELLAEMLEAPLEEVGADAHLTDDLEVDSLQRLELMTSIERRLGIRLDAEDWSDGESILELAQRVELHLDEAARE